MKILIAATLNVKKACSAVHVLSAVNVTPSPVKKTATLKKSSAANAFRGCPKLSTQCRSRAAPMPRKMPDMDKNKMDAMSVEVV